MKMPTPEQLVISIAAPVNEQISDLAKNSLPVVAEILLTVGDHLLEPGFKVSRALGEGSKRRRQQRATEFHRAIGLPVGEFALRMRLEVARRILISTDLEIERIPSLVGLSRTVFYERFREQFGKPPTEYQRDPDEAGQGAMPLAITRGAFGPLVEISTAGFNETAIAMWLEAIVCELPASACQTALRETSFDSPALFEALSKRSLEEGRRDAQRGIELAELALVSLEGSSSALGDLAEVLRVRGLARLGNARRLANDHEGADRELRRAELALERIAAAQKPAAAAEFLCYRGTLRLFERRFDEAHEDLHRAVGLCQSTKQDRLEASAWIQIANMNISVGDCTRARTPLLAARQIVESKLSDDRHLRLCLLTQLAYAEAESENADAAMAILSESRILAVEEGHRRAELQADWIEATARTTKGERAVAEGLLRQAREGFIGLHDVGHTAIVSLDLALLIGEQDRSAEIVSLAAAALPALESLRLPEAAVALSMLRNAISAGHVEKKLLVAARKLLMQPGRRPSRGTSVQPKGSIPGP